MLIDKVCGLNEMESENRNGKSELKKEMLKRKSKSEFSFQNVFEQEIKKEKYNENYF